jgi:hypothetical protein
MPFAHLIFQEVEKVKEIALPMVQNKNKILVIQYLLRDSIIIYLR